jgi:large subunit ribosomal protein L6
MSRIGKKPVEIKEGVTVTVNGNNVVVSGSRGELTFPVPAGIKVEVVDGQVKILRESETKVVRSLHGSIQRVIDNMIKGVSEGWTKTLELIGTGYRARVEGRDLILAIGFSHPVKFAPPEGVTFEVQENKIIITGLNRQVVGQIAANIRAVRPPEPYKGKGVKYDTEKIRRKAGKAAKAGA